MVNLTVVEQLLNHIRSSSLCKTTDKILLAVSGGLDSMVMFHLLKDAGMTIGVAHCNFQLRGPESNDDELFVRDTCTQYDIPCYVASFDTKKFANESGISIQMAARDLRYAFFQNVVQKYGYDYVATAHHFGDVIESILLNLVRGTGIDGLRGIVGRKQNIIRPMLFANRDMILSYAQTHSILWREDTSNETDDYPRNFIRHQVIPRLEDLNPAFQDNFRSTHERLLAAREYALAFLEGLRSSAMHVRPDGSVNINIAQIAQVPYPAVLLWELIKDTGFRYDQCKQITAQHQAGKIFFSDTHQLVVDRSTYILEKRRLREFASFTIGREQHLAGDKEHGLVLREYSSADFELKKDSRICQVDADKLKYPLVWRRWQSGDYFIPLGMQAEKKVSDFLIDLKIPFNHKADVTVLESGGEIVWIVGYRINERYKVTSQTKHILVVESTVAAD
jgi:tRNA(Ile)-lysidine synthase